MGWVMISELKNMHCRLHILLFAGDKKQSCSSKVYILFGGNACKQMITIPLKLQKHNYIS